MVKIDVKDKKLLFELTQDCRQSDTQLAKKIGLSKNAVKYRTKRLVNEGVITQFSTIINLDALNICTAIVLFKFNADVYQEKEIINYFKNHFFTDWVELLSGNWDVLVEFVFSDLNKFERIMQEVHAYFGNNLNITRHFFSLDIIKVDHFIHEIYGEINTPLKTQQKKQKNKVSITKEEKQLLSVLSKDASQSFVALAQQLNSSVDIVRYHYKKLIDEGVLIQCLAEINPRKLGYEQYVTLLKLHNTEKESVQQLKQFVKQQGNIIYAFVDMISSTLFLVSSFSSFENMDQNTRIIRQQWRSIIKDQEYVHIKERVKFNLFPEGLSIV